MAAKLSAGILLHRSGVGDVREVLIVHPGGPFWAKKDDGAWSLPKGEYEEGEVPDDVARREFGEELGIELPVGDLVELAVVKQPSGKIITGFAQEGTVDLAGFVSNTFEMEWPRGTGNVREYPEVDRAEWMSLARARVKLLKGQVPFVDALVASLEAAGGVVNEGVAEVDAADDDQGALF